MCLMELASTKWLYGLLQEWYHIEELASVLVTGR